MSISWSTRFGSLLIVLLMAACGRLDDPGPALDRLRGGDYKVTSSLLAYCAEERDDSPEVYQAMIGVGSPLIPSLIKSLTGRNEKVRMAAAVVLGNLAAPEAVHPLIEAFREATGRRAVYIWALGQIKDPASLPFLIEVMTGSDTVLGREATRSVIKIGKRAVPDLEKAVRETPQGRRGQLYLAIGDIGDHRAAGTLLACDPAEEVEEYLWGLGRVGDAGAVSRCLEFLASPQPRVRLAAAQALYHLNQPASIPDLEQARDNDPEALVREWAARALETITGDRQYYRNDKGEMVLPYNLYR